MSDVSSTRAPKSAVRPSRYLVALAGLALLVLLSLPFAVNDYLLYVVNLTLVYALAAVGFNIVLGYLGQLAFANAAFFGIGAYAFAVSTSAWNLPFLAALAFAAAVGGATGFVVGLLAPRLRRGCAATTSQSSPWSSVSYCAGSTQHPVRLYQAERRRIGFSARAWCRCLRDEIFFPR